MSDPASDSITEPTKRQALPWSPWRKFLRGAFVWPFDLDDGSGDGSPSAAKMIAWLFAFLVVASVLFRLPISGVQFGVMAMVLSAAFGRSMYSRWLTRHESRVSATDTTSRTENRSVQEILQRRELGKDDGTEPS